MSHKVSVIINFHNGEKYLINSIKSVLDQEYQDYELILWDNNSTDNSKEIIKKFNDKRIKYYHNSKKVPLYEARNMAIKKSDGDLIAFLDCDDWWEKNYLSSREKNFENPDFDYFYCNTNFFFEKNKKYQLYKKFNLPKGKIFDQLAKDYFIIISGVIFRKKVFENSYFNEKYSIIGDYDFLMRISKKFNAHSNNQPLLNYRLHDKNFLKLNSKMYYQEYKDWYHKNLNDNFFFKKKNLFEKKLKNLEISYLIKNQNKDFNILIKILNSKDLKTIVKFLILFFIPKIFYKYLIR